MRFYTLLLVVLTANLSFAQKTKQHVLNFSVWEYPKYYIPDTKIAIVSDEAVPQRCKIDFFVLRQLNFRSLQIVKPNDANYKLQIKLANCAFETEFERSYKPDETAGKVVLRADFHCVVMKANEVVYDFISTHKRDVLSKKLPLNKEDFTKAIMDEVLDRDKNFPTRYDEIYLKLTGDFVYQLKQDFDFVLKEVPYILHTFEDKELEHISLSVHETIALFEKQELNDQTLAPKIRFWEETASNYDPADKKQKRIYWVLMKNIAASYFFLGNYPKALEYKEKADLANYKNNDTYPKRNVELIIANRQPYQKIEKLREFASVDFSNKQDFTNIEIVNSRQLTEDFAQEEKSDFNLKEKKVELISKLLWLDASYKFLDNISKYAETFNKESYQAEKKKGKERSFREFYLSFDKVYLNLIQENRKIIDQIKVFDVSVFSDEEKVQIADISDDIDVLYLNLSSKEVMSRYDETRNPENEMEHQINLMMEEYIIYDLLLSHIKKSLRQRNHSKIDELYRQFFKYQSENVKKIPYLDYLAYTLTNSEALSRENNFELYEKYHKEYKKIYFDLFYSNDFKQIHSKDIDVLLHPAVSQYYKLAMYKPNKEKAPNFIYDENTIKKILLLLVN